ncbi:uncharacterized protein PRCAT00002626001 [Priceomyces carsonii]|uniref:uncharacterized protein n=1 Tax=Priceomyces carsonii TaxID=28549 RepID=UPI002ED8730C|nr:unnamed protein product [Priceomyces carsonii]
MENDGFKVQINDYDSYQSPPSKLDQLYGQVRQVPIIRIYGSVAIAGGCCNILVHVHNCYPYLYLEAKEEDLHLLSSEKYISSIVEYLETKITSSFKKANANDDEESELDMQIEANETTERSRAEVGDDRRKYIANVVVCKGFPIYGYYMKRKLFYKISLLSPLYKTRLTKLIHDKEISFESVRLKFGAHTSSSSSYVFESHLQYLMQFMTDFNLFGCAWLEINDFHFRSPIVCRTVTSDFKESLKSYVRCDNVLREKEFTRIGTSLLEIDVSTKNITNRDLLKERDIHSGLFELNKFKNGIFDHEVYLSSVHHVYEDLKYQCESRNLSMVDSQGLHDMYQGMGETKWSNQSALNDLLQYVVTLNKQNMKKDATFKEEIDSYSTIPTCFEVVDVQKYKKSSFPMGRRELYVWNLYEELFTDNSPSDVSTEKHYQFPPEISFNSTFTQSNDEMDDDQIEVINDSNHEIKEIDADSDPKLEIILDSFTSKSLPKNTVIESADDISLHLISGNDGIDESMIFEMTQRQNKKRSFSDVSELEIDSIQVSSTPLSQNSGIKGYSTQLCAYELITDLNLQRDNIYTYFDQKGLLRVNYKDPSYERESDMPSKSMVFANRRISVQCFNDDTLPWLEFSKRIKDTLAIENKDNSYNLENWQYAMAPPLKDEILAWIRSEEAVEMKKREKYRSQIEPPLSIERFKFSYCSAKVKRRPDGYFNLSNFYLEIHSKTRNDLLPNPLTDPISAIFFLFDDTNNMFSSLKLKNGILCLKDCLSEKHPNFNTSNVLNDCEVFETFDNESEMIDRLVGIVEILDPDILSGYEINASSWGYIIERFKHVHEINMLARLSRCISRSNGTFGDRWGYTHTSSIKINGRHMLNIWRLIKSDLSLTDYSLENVSYHLLHQSIPKYANKKLSEWLLSNDYMKRNLFFKYYLCRVQSEIKIVEIQEYVTRNVEFSRLIGIDFNSNFYRGSQFKVESILSRICKQENLLLNAPSKKQVHVMRPLECIPLVMEPNSSFYKSPLLVLDFQSLYPSTMIAYNYCYSTLLGKLNNFKNNKNHIGYVKNLSLPPGLVEFLVKENAVNVSPNGFMFVKRSVRKSILSKMLREILDIRFQVKSVMKILEDDKELKKLQNSRQLALKLIANVTYGYTSATFSGRMPNSDIADAIVSTAREILTQSIELIESSGVGAKVVYGDTDSLFVYLPGKSRNDAFKIGNQLCLRISKAFPDPITLKFEKVYHPCLLLSKKRYVGYSFENQYQREPKFDAKGIETIRRDGIPAQQKIVEKALRILFDTKNLTKVKCYVLEQFQKIIMNKVPLNDFCFAKEVRYGTYKNEAYLPPGAIVAKRRILHDARSEPQYRERVPYVVIRNSEKPRIKDRSVSPEEYIKSYDTAMPMVLDYEYYITKVLIPPLERLFNLIGVNIKSWYDELPKMSTISLDKASTFNALQSLNSNNCLYCGSHLEPRSVRKLCKSCIELKSLLISKLFSKLKEHAAKFQSLEHSCGTCNNANFGIVGNRTVEKNISADCINKCCIIYWNKFRAKNESHAMFQKNSEILEQLDW